MSPARLLPRHILLLSFVLVLGGGVGCPVAKADTDADQGSLVAGAAVSTTIIYGAEFIARFPNVVSVLDLIPRIPGAEQILGDPRMRQYTQKRGFSGNEDSVLINGKRVSGKSNDSRSALGRINIDQVERVEIIRGANPDIKVSSQRGIINVVLKEGVSTASGSWRVNSRTPVNSGSTRFGGFLSYGGALGALEYFASAEVRPWHRTVEGGETTFAADGSILEVLDEPVTRSASKLSLATNLIYSFDNGGQLRLNGAFEDENPTTLFEGEAFVPDMMGNLVFDGNSLRIEEEKKPNWEVGADYERQLGEALKLKVLALYSSADEAENQWEDYRFGAGEDVAYDVISLSDEPATEAIGRASLSWSLNPAHQLEFGSEMAVNTLDVDLSLQERIGGILTDIDVSSSDLKVKETRNESFLIHSWTISPRLSLESALFAEWSKLSQQGSDVSTSRTFFFLRPSIDLRYDLTPRDQFQLSFRRDIEQLDFRDFATSVSRDNDIVAGNVDLVQAKKWIVEASFEHRTAGGAMIKISAANWAMQDYKAKAEISPGVSGVGNVGAARFSQLTIEGSWPATLLGLSGLKFEGEVRFRNSRYTDPFTGGKHSMDRFSKLRFTLGFRHDITDWGVSYGVRDEYQATEPLYDIDEIIFRNPNHRVTVFVEGKVPYGATLRLELGNAASADFGRDRVLYAGGRTAPPTGNELRVRDVGPVAKVSIRGNF